MSGQMRYKLLCGLLAIIGSWTAHGARADYLRVEPDAAGDYATIQDAIDACADGDVVLLADGSFRGNGNRDLNTLGKRIVLRSESQNQEACIIDCEGTAEDPHRGIVMISGETPWTIIRDLTITNAYATSEYEHEHGGGILCGASPSIHNCIISHCHARDGGGIFSTGPAYISDCEIRANTATEDGGGVYFTVTDAVLARIIREC